MPIAAKSQDYTCSIKTKVSASEAQRAIGEPSTWLWTDFEGKAQRLNDIFIGHVGDIMVKFKVTEMVPEKRIVWQVTDCHLSWLEDKKEWKGTKIVWELSAKNGSTEIKFTHVGLVPGIECYDDCQRGWGLYIKKSLAKLLSSGEGMPGKF